MGPVQEIQKESAGVIIGKARVYAANELSPLDHLKKEGPFPTANYEPWLSKHIIVYGVSLDSSLDFFVQLNGVQTNIVLDRVAAYIERTPEINKRSSFNKTEGSPCLALFSEDELWYRAHILKDLGDGVYQVEFVDYGNVEMVKSEEIIACPADLCEFPVGISVAAIHGFTGDESAEELEILKSLVVQQDIIGVIDSVVFAVKNRTRMLLTLFTCNMEPIKTVVQREVNKRRTLAAGDANGSVKPQELAPEIVTPTPVPAPAVIAKVHPVDEIKVVEEKIIPVLASEPASLQPETIIPSSVLEEQHRPIRPGTPTIESQVEDSIDGSFSGIPVESVVSAELNLKHQEHPPTQPGLDTEINSITAKRNEPEPLTVERIEEEIEQITDESKELEQKIAVRKELEQIIGDGKVLEQVARESKELEQKIAVRKELEQITGKSKELEQITVERMELEQKIAVQKELEQMTVKSKELEQKIAVRKELEQITGKSKELEQITPEENKLAQITAERNELEQVTAGRNELEQLTAEKKNYENLIQSLIQEKNMLEERLKNDCQTLQLQNESLKVSFLDEQTKAVKIAVARKEQEMTDNFSNLLHTAIGAKDAEITQLTNSIAELQSQLTEKNAKIVCSENQKRALMQSIQDSNNDLAMKQAEVNVAKESLVKCSQDWEKKLAEKEHSLRTQHESELAILNAKNDDLTTKLEAIVDEHKIELEKQKVAVEHQVRQEVQRQFQLDDGRQTPMVSSTLARAEKTLSGEMDFDAVDSGGPEAKEEIMLNLSTALVTCLKSSQKNVQKYKTIIAEKDSEIARLCALLQPRID